MSKKTINQFTAISIDEFYDEILDTIVEEEKKKFNRRFNTKSEFLRWSIRTFLSQEENEELRKKITKIWDKLF